MSSTLTFCTLSMSAPVAEKAALCEIVGLAGKAKASCQLSLARSFPIDACPADGRNDAFDPSQAFMTKLPTEFPDFGLTPRQRRQAVRGHYWEWPGMDGERGEIWCYSDRFSYRRGET